MKNAPNQEDASVPRRPRGPQGLGEQAARALEHGLGTGEGIRGVEEKACLKAWFEESGRLIAEDEWTAGNRVSTHTAEHEVRYRQADHRAIYQ